MAKTGAQRVRGFPSRVLDFQGGKPMCGVVQSMAGFRYPGPVLDEFSCGRYEAILGLDFEFVPSRQERRKVDGE